MTQLHNTAQQTKRGISVRVLQQNWGTFAVAFVPRKDTVLYAVAHQRRVDAHVSVAKECTAYTGC